MRAIHALTDRTVTDDALRLLADIGGTNARFALQRTGHAPARYRVLATAEHDGPKAAIDHYLGMFEDASRPGAAAIAIAGPITSDRIRLTNNRWAFSIRSLRRRTGIAHLFVLNDFEALAWSLPVLKPRDLESIGGGRPTPGAPLAVFGPGTGLGVSCLLPENPDKPGGAKALATEGGHASVAAGTPREAAVIAKLHDRFGHVSAERVLSGPGLANIYRALGEIDGGDDAPQLRPDEIATLAQGRKGGREGRRARETVRLFSALAGSFAGDLALLFGARGGVYVGGGVIPHLGTAFDRRLFRRRFEGKGRFKVWLVDVPVHLIQHRSPAMLGLGRFLDYTETVA